MEGSQRPPRDPCRRPHGGVLGAGRHGARARWRAAGRLERQPGCGAPGERDGLPRSGTAAPARDTGPRTAPGLTAVPGAGPRVAPPASAARADDCGLAGHAPGRHTMATDTALLPPTVRDAALALHAARERVRTHQRGYDRLRHRGDLQATSRARSEWGLAILEFIEASVTLAEAKDHRSAAWAAS